MSASNEVKRLAVYVICPLHSRPGAFMRGITRPGPEPGSVMVLCPACVQLGAQIRDRTGLQLVQDVQRAKPAEIEQAAKDQAQAGGA